MRMKINQNVKIQSYYLNLQVIFYDSDWNPTVDQQVSIIFMTQWFIYVTMVTGNGQSS